MHCSVFLLRSYLFFNCGITKIMGALSPQLFKGDVVTRQQMGFVNWPLALDKTGHSVAFYSLDVNLRSRCWK